MTCPDMSGPKNPNSRPSQRTRPSGHKEVEEGGGYAYRQVEGRRVEGIDGHCPCMHVEGPDMMIHPHGMPS